jgi:hypothetical protein
LLARIRPLKSRGFALDGRDHALDERLILLKQGR